MAPSASFPSAEPRELETLDSESQWGKTVSTLLGPFASLKLTVVLLVLGMVLVFWATLGQADLGVWGVQHKFFHSLFVLQKFGNSDVPVPVFPKPKT